MVEDPDVFLLHNYGANGLSTRPNGVCTGSNSGYQAVNIAVLAGAKRILLVGYDMRFTGGRSHSHNGHSVNVTEMHYLQHYAPRFKSMKPVLAEFDVEVINCTPDSAIEAFPRGDLESVLSD